MFPSSLLLAGHVSYGIGEYSVRLLWQLSSDEDVDNYTLTLCKSEQIIEILHSNIRSIELNLTYYSPWRSMAEIVQELEIHLYGMFVKVSCAQYLKINEVLPFDYSWLQCSIISD